MEYNVNRITRRLNRRMEKRAASFLPLAGGVISGIGNMMSMASVYLIAGSILAGMGVGKLAAKFTSKGDQDIETAQKSYENERLKGDIGYLKARAQQEFADQQRRKATGQKSMMLI